MKTFLLASLLTVAGLVANTSIQAQRPLGKPVPFSGSSGITIETAYDKEQATLSLAQLLDTSIYKVRGPIPLETGAIFFAQRTLPGAPGVRLLLRFTVSGPSRLDKRTTVSAAGYYQDGSMKYPEAVLNQEERLMATSWAIEQQLATAYPDPAAKLWYRDDTLKETTRARVWTGILWDKLEAQEAKRTSKGK